MYKIFDMRTCGLSHQIKGPVIVHLTIFLMKPVLANFTVVGPLIWCDNPHVRMSKILYINNNDFHNMGSSQMCAGACYVFRTSEPHAVTRFLHPLSTYYPIWLNPLFTLPLPYISSSSNCHSLSTLPLYSSSLPSLHPLFLLTGHKTTPHVTTPLLHSFWASH